MLDSYDEQLKELDQQISQEMLKQNSEQTEQTQSSEKEEEPKTEQEIEKERVSHLVGLLSGLSRSRAVQSSQTKVEGEARVLESEIKLDKERSGETEIIAKKRTLFSELCTYRK